MKSATFRAAVLTAGLMVSGAAAADGAANLYAPVAKPQAQGVVMNGDSDAGDASPIVGNPAAGNATVIAPGSGKVAPEAEPSTGFLSEHALSTLGALALGIIGLLWVRRHTAEM